MKSLLAITAALCSVTSAWPLMPWIKLAPPATGTQFYQLQTKSATAAVNNQWITLPSGTTNYGLVSAQASASKFFVQKYNATNTWAFHNSDDTRQIALRGPTAAFLYLVDVTSPTSGSIPAGQLMEWATFTMDNNVLGVNDGSSLKSRTFVAVKGTGSAYTLALYDGVSNSTDTFTPMTINLVRSGST